MQRRPCALCPRPQCRHWSPEAVLSLFGQMLGSERREAHASVVEFASGATEEHSMFHTKLGVRFPSSSAIPSGRLSVLDRLNSRHRAFNRGFVKKVHEIAL